MSLSSFLIATCANTTNFLDGFENIGQEIAKICCQRAPKNRNLRREGPLNDRRIRRVVAEKVSHVRREIAQINRNICRVIAQEAGNIRQEMAEEFRNLREEIDEWRDVNS